MIAPAARSFSTTVASYGGIQPARIFDAAVVATPRVTRYVLERDRHAGERAERLAGLARAIDVVRGLARASASIARNAPSLRVEVRDPRELRVDSRRGGELARRDLRRGLRGRQPVRVTARRRR